jgi:putative nucleotidyltransferase with HDIG domain
MTTVNSAPVRQVLIVDDEDMVRRALVAILKEGAVASRTAASTEEALKLLTTEPFSAIISDLKMAGLSGMDLLDQVHQRYPHVAFLMVTGVDDVGVAIQAMQRGADDYLVKPLQLDVVLYSLERALKKKRLEMEVEKYRLNLEQMVVERTEQLERALRQIEHSYEDTLEALGEAIDLRDSATAGHSHRVSEYSVTILAGLGGSKPQLKNITMGALLHDIGKLATPDAILRKPGPLTAEERKVMQEHVQVGYDLVKRITFLADAAELILMHHERCDGSGYPYGLKGVDIPLSAKIFAVADTVDAMTTDRPYQTALPLRAAREYVARGAGVQFDERVSSVFLGIPDAIWDGIRNKTIAKASSGKEIRDRLARNGLPVT